MKKIKKINRLIGIALKYKGMCIKNPIILLHICCMGNLNLHDILLKENNRGIM